MYIITRSFKNEEGGIHRPETSGISAYRLLPISYEDKGEAEG